MALKIVKTRLVEEALQPVALTLPTKNDPLEAIHLLEKVLDADPVSNEVFVNLEALCRKNDQPEALKRTLLTRVRAVFDPEALNRLGVVMFKEGRRREALRCFETARRYGSEQAIKNLKEVQKTRSNPRDRRKPDPEIDALIQLLNPKLSACLIVKNEAAFLGTCLESLQGLVDEIIVVDTGSTDETVRIAKRYGAKVFHFDWNDDFAAARNESLRHATGDWVLVIDADEHVSPESKEELRRAIANPQADAYQIELVNLFSDGRENAAVVPRLFRLKDGVRYAGRIHEQIVENLVGLGYRFHASPVRLIHEGYREEVVQQKEKHERNFRLLEKALEEQPDDAYLRFQFVKQVLFTGGDLERALALLEPVCRQFEAMVPPPPFGAEAFLSLARIQVKLERTGEAVTTCLKGRAMYPGYPDLGYQLALCLRSLGRHREAIQHFQESRKPSDITYPCESDPGIRAWKALHGEAECLMALRSPAAAIALLKPVASPHRDLQSLLAEAYLQNGQPALALAETFAFSPNLEGEDWKRLAKAFFRLGSYAEALDALKNAPVDAENHCLTGESLLWLGQPNEALEAFEAGVSEEPENRAAHSGLAVCQLILGDRVAARASAANGDRYLGALINRLDGSGFGHVEPSAWSLLLRHSLVGGGDAFAESLIAFALEEATRLPLLARSFARVLLDLEIPSLALDLLSAALPTSERDLEHLLMIGETTERLGNRDMALAAYQACLELRPGHPTANERLENLEKSPK